MISITVFWISWLLKNCAEQRKAFVQILHLHVYIYILHFYILHLSRFYDITVTFTFYSLNFTFVQILHLHCPDFALHFSYVLFLSKSIDLPKKISLLDFRKFFLTIVYIVKEIAALAVINSLSTISHVIELQCDSYSTGSLKGVCILWLANAAILYSVSCNNGFQNQIFYYHYRYCFI